MPLAISLINVSRRYGKVEAVRNISLSVSKGSIFGLLGPNGAGKTTLVEMIEGLRQPDSGEIRVCGLDPFAEAAAVYRKLGIGLQSGSFPDKLRVSEVLRLFASLYCVSRNLEEILSENGLQHVSERYVQALSGGERQRLNFALALINNPELVILDEPTAGLDVLMRQRLHGQIAALKERKVTVLLTTHDLDEAARLCDSIALIQGGVIVDSGPIEEFKLRWRTPVDEQAAGRAALERAYSALMR